MCKYCPGRWVSCSRCFHVGKSPMTAWERLKLSPFQKWKFYGLPPWKFFIALLLIISTTVSIYELSRTFTPYQRAQTENWESMLIPDSIDSETVGSKTKYFIYTVDEFMQCVSQFVDTYYTLNTSVVGNYVYLYTNTPQQQEAVIQPATMSTTSYKYPEQIFNPDNENFDASTVSNSYELNNTNDTGPFANSTTRLEQIHGLISMTLSFEIKNLGYNHGYRTCYVDTVDQRYDFYYRGRIDLSIDPSVYICTEQYNTSLWNRQYIILVLFLAFSGIFSIVLEFLHIKAVFKHIAIFQLAKSKSTEQFRNLTLSDKLEFFNFWFITTTIANVSNIIGSIWVCSLLLVTSSGSSWDGPLFFVGFGCMFTWISGIQYFEMFPQYYALILTLKKSAPRVLAFLVGVLPVFLGFAYFGVAYFSTGSALFSNVDQSSVALFALLNGDVIHDVFDNIYPISPVLSRLYLYTFISLFIYAVLNIFIAIVEDAFFAAKQETEIEIDEDIQQQKYDIHDLDVVGLVAGPPLPLTGSMMNIYDENGDESSRFDSVLSASKRKSIPINSSSKPGGYSKGVISSALHSRHSAQSQSREDVGLDDEDAAEHDEYSSRGIATNELSAPLLAQYMRHSVLSRSERLLLQTDEETAAAQIKRQQNKSSMQRHQALLKILSQLITSYNKQFISDIKAILSAVNTELRPPHSFENYPCGFSDCIYCALKTMLQSNMQTLRNNVAHSIESTVQLQAKQQTAASSNRITAVRQHAHAHHTTTESIIESGDEDSSDEHTEQDKHTEENDDHH